MDTCQQAIKNENGIEVATTVTIEDATTTLLYNIAKYFIGEPKIFQHRSLEILNNLYSKRLGDFK